MWKNTLQVDLTPLLGQGSHELRIEVENQNGYPALIAYCKSLKLFSGEDWEASRDGKIWTQALSAGRMKLSPISRKFQRADRAFFSKLYVFLPVFIMVFICSLLYHQKDRHVWMNYITPSSRGIRWILIGSWVILAINNIGKIPMYIGMDVGGHLKYILYVAENWRIPLPSEGWQMFEAPFFYIISAAIYKFCLNLMRCVVSGAG